MAVTMWAELQAAERRYDIVVRSGLLGPGAEKLVLRRIDASGFNPRADRWSMRVVHMFPSSREDDRCVRLPNESGGALTSL